jgi:hypothetical protein
MSNGLKDYSAAKKNGDIDPFSIHLRRTDGSPIAVDVQGTPMHWPGGQFIGIVGTFRVVESSAVTVF